MAFNGFPQFNITVGSASTSTTLQSSVSYDGVVFTFDRAMPVGQFANGEPFVVSDQAFAITAISPASASQNGAVANGTMKNPYFGNGFGDQGFDEFFADFPPQTLYEMPYSSGLNIDPAISGAAPIALGEQASIVKSLRASGKTSNAAQFQTVDRYVVLSVLDSAPPVNSLRPGMAGSLKKLRQRPDDFVPRNIALPASWPSVETILAECPDNLGCFTGDMVKTRFFRLDNALGTTNDGYSGEFVEHHARFIYAVNSSDVTENQRAEIIDKILVFANDIEAILDVGGNVYGGAGQGGSWWQWPMAAAGLTKDDALMTKIRSALAAPDRTTLWITSSMVGSPAPGASGVAAQTYFDEHVGTPWIQPDEVTSSFSGRYVGIAAKIAAWEALAILAFDQGPAGYANGAEMILNGGTNDPANAWASLLGFAARRRQWSPDFYAGYGMEAAWEDAWDDMVATGDFTPWVGIPDQPAMGGLLLVDPYFSAGAGAVTLDTQGVDYATEPVTQVDLRYSLDAIQWVVDHDITLSGDTYTRSGLLKGAVHWCGWRQHSMSGAGLWSENHPYGTPITSGADRGKVTTTGNESNAAPVNTVVPIIHARLHPAWEYPVWAEKAGVLSGDDVELAAGVGYWSGFPAPSYTFQWKRDGANISGATTQIYNRTASDASTNLTCEITATNSSGSTTVTTAAVAAPALTTLPAGTLIDTNFRGAFAVDYTSELGSISGDNYTVTHEPAVTPDGYQGVNFGALRFDKTGSFPKGKFSLSRAAAPNTAYDITAQLYVKDDTIADRGDFTLKVKEQGGTTLFTATYQFPDDGNGDGVILADIVGSFTTGSILGLEVEVAWSGNTGFTAGGDPYLTHLTIAQS